MKQSHFRFIDTTTRRTVVRLLGGVVIANSWLAACTTPSASSTKPSIPRALTPGGSLEQFVQHLANQNQFSGTLLVAKGAQPVLLKAYGQANKVQHLPNRADTIYALGSVTKSFTAVAIMQLVQQGKLALQDHLGTYLSGFPPAIANAVTIDQLLTHTSGMGNYQMVDQSEQRSWTTAAQTMTGLLDIIRQQPLLFAPGTNWSYSNSGYATLGEIVQQVTGQSYYDAIRQHIFQVAGMSQSDFYTRPQHTQNQQIAHPYARVGSQFLQLRGPNAPKNGTLIDASQDGGFIGAPDGGAYSTVGDLMRYSQALQSYQLLNKASTKLLMAGKVKVPPHPGYQSDMYAYGLGDSIFNGQRLVWHNGGGPGTAAQFEMYPTLGWTVVILSNYDPGQPFQALVKEVEDLVTRA
jgi:CubicO group peptidase (beta-lactamase class C family)